ncbi:zinc-binding dehydrogenase [Streptomyces sp. NPDC048663]|uniref:zinc-binding dehydrogenase n=1 Tax=Streptomyces sp. NPDC048663 TaxID=3155638 RepID=UPI00342CD17F
MNAQPEDLQRIADAIVAGELSVPIAATFPVEQIREAVQLQGGRRVHGKIVVNLSHKGKAQSINSGHRPPRDRGDGLATKASRAGGCEKPVPSPPLTAPERWVAFLLCPCALPRPWN